MRVFVLTAVSLALVLLVSTSESMDKTAPASARQIFDLSNCSGCGAEKLTDDELSNLVSIITSHRGISYLEQSAHQYMTQQGWLPTEIIGYKKVVKEPTTIEEIQILAIREGRLFTLEGPITKQPLMTGLYWSKGIGSSWEILNSDGSHDTYWTREEK